MRLGAVASATSHACSRAVIQWLGGTFVVTFILRRLLAVLQLPGVAWVIASPGGFAKVLLLQAVGSFVAFSLQVGCFAWSTQVHLNVCFSTEEDVEAVFCCVGGGGLLAGVASFLKAVKPSIKASQSRSESLEIHKDTFDVKTFKERLKRRKTYVLNSY